MKVLVIYTGGLLITGEFSVQSAEKKLQADLELQLVANVDIKILHHLAGADVPFSLASEIGQAIMANYAHYDGFVVMHSIDNVIYTANLLAFQLTNLGKPVIFTGTTLSENFFKFPGNFSPTEQLAYREMSLRTSLVTSVQLATLNCRGVLLAYGPHIVQAMRASKSLVPDQNGFTAWPNGDVASVRFGIELNPRTPSRQDELEPSFNPTYSDHIVLLQQQPEFTFPALPSGTAGVLLEAYHEQALPSNMEYPDDILIVVVGNTSVKKTLPPQILLLPPLPFVTVQMKLMAGAGHAQSWQALKEYMASNQAGELEDISL